MIPMWAGPGDPPRYKMAPQPCGGLCCWDEAEVCLEIIKNSLRKPNYIFTSGIKMLVPQPSAYHSRAFYPVIKPDLLLG